jgi:hypothetical protein
VKMSHLVPPYLSREEAKRRALVPEDRWKIGIDDHIASGGNFDPWDSEANPFGLHYFEYRRSEYRRLPGTSRDSRTDARDRKFIDWLESSFGPHGVFSVSDAARALGWHRDTVLQAKRSCRHRGVLEVWDGKPLGEGRGNSPHSFRFVLAEKDEQSG